MSLLGDCSPGSPFCSVINPAPPWPSAPLHHRRSLVNEFVECPDTGISQVFFQGLHFLGTMLHSDWIPSSDTWCRFVPLGVSVLAVTLISRSHLPRFSSREIMLPLIVNKGCWQILWGGNNVLILTNFHSQVHTRQHLRPELTRADSQDALSWVSAFFPFIRQHAVLSSDSLFCQWFMHL